MKPDKLINLLFPQEFLQQENGGGRQKSSQVRPCCTDKKIMVGLFQNLPGCFAQWGETEKSAQVGEYRADKKIKEGF